MRIRGRDLTRGKGLVTATPVLFGSATALNEPPPAPAPENWQALFDGGNHDALRDWYRANTGLAALGRTRASLTPGSLTSEYDGQVFDGIVGAQIKIGHNNVTYRGCKVESTGAGYGAQFTPTFTANVRGALIEYCEMEYVPTALDNETRHAMIFYNGTSVDVPNPRALTVRYSHIQRYTSSGGRLGSNIHYEYNWVHDFQYPVGPHANSARIAGWNTKVYRSLFNEGRSAICSIYFDDRPVGNAIFEENVLYGVQPATPSYHFTLKEGPDKAAAKGIKIINNKIGGFTQFGEFNGVSNLWGRDGNELSGNRYFDTNELVSWNQS